MLQCAHRLALRTCPNRPRAALPCSPLRAAAAQLSGPTKDRRAFAASAIRQSRWTSGTQSQIPASNPSEQAEKAAYRAYAASQGLWNKLPLWYPEDTARLHKLLQDMSPEDVQELAPCPEISDASMWTLFNHTSCYDIDDQSDMAVIESPFTARSYEAYAEYGFGVLDFALTKLLANCAPNLGRLGIAHMRRRLQTEDVLARLAYLYHFRECILCDNESYEVLQFVRSYEASSDVFKAYIYAVFKEHGTLACESWLFALFTPMVRALYMDFGGCNAFVSQDPETQFQNLGPFRYDNVAPLSQLVLESAPSAMNGKKSDEQYLDIWGAYAEEGWLPGWDSALREGIPRLHEYLINLTPTTLADIVPCPPLSPVSQWTVFQHKSCYNTGTRDELLEVQWPAQWYNVYAMQGDALMNYIVSRMLETCYPNLTRMGIILMRNRLIANNVFSHIAVIYGFMQRVHVCFNNVDVVRHCQTLGHAGDVFEAYVWAVYREHGVIACAEWIVRLFTPLAQALYEDHGGVHAYSQSSTEAQRKAVRTMRRANVDYAVGRVLGKAAHWQPKPARYSRFKGDAIYQAQLSRRS